jgi:NAD(P)-dependent dehydrogenase (short-subunit alcohol dehydrogenase family)
MTARLSGKVAVITGAGSGIGAATARIFAQEGAKVSLCDRNEDPVRAVMANILSQGGDAIAVQADVRSPEDVQNLVTTTSEHYGKLDVPFNNAGVRASRSTVVDLTEDEYEETMAIDLKGVWLCSKYAIPKMIKNGGGAIVNCSSVSALLGQPRQGVYNAAKAGVDALTKCMALDFATHNIRVNSVNPGWVKTQMNAAELEEISARGGQEYESILRLHPLGRLGTPEDIAWAVVYLASDEARWVTGSSLVIDGGYCCQ